MVSARVPLHARVWRSCWRLGQLAGLTARGILSRPFYVAASAPPDPAELSSILILRVDQVGDMVQTTPLIRALKQALPHTRISVLSSATSGDVLRGNPDVAEVIVGGEVGSETLPPAVLRQRFSLVIDPSPCEHDFYRPRLVRAMQARWRLGFDTRGGRARSYELRVPPAAPTLSAAEVSLELCRRGLRLELGAPRPRIYLSEEERSAAAGFLRGEGFDDTARLVLLHPGGSFSRKLWPAERFAELADILRRERGLAAVLVGGPADRGLLARAAAHRPSVPRLECDDLRLFMAVVGRARLLVCNNSGPLHVADALDVPTVSTFWSDQDAVIAALWMPRDPRHRVLARPCLAELGVSEVLEVVEAQLKAAC